MIVTRVISPQGAGAEAKLGLPQEFAPGQVLTGRIHQMQPDGRGLLRLADGSGIAFSGGSGLVEGEQVKLQVVRLTPETALRVVASESRQAQNLAQTTEQSLIRAPDLFNRLVGLLRPAPTAPAFPVALPASAPPVPPHAAITGQGLAPAAPGQGMVTSAAPGPGLTPPGPGLTPAAPAPGMMAAGVASPVLPLLPATGSPLRPLMAAPLTASPEPTASTSAPASSPFALVTEQGEPLPRVLQRLLPTLSLPGLSRGDGAALQRLLAAHAMREPLELARQVREQAAGLRWELSPVAERQLSPEQRHGLADELNTARTTLHRLSDLLVSQEVLPRAPMVTTDGSLVTGYWMFWLGEEGMGEVIWRQEGRAAARGEREQSILVHLEMTQLGVVQARLALGADKLTIALAAEGEEALTLLRGNLGELRERLQWANLPPFTLELAQLHAGVLRAERQGFLDVAAGFEARA